MSRLGIIAGGGALPRQLRDACEAQGRACFVMGFTGQTDRQTSPDAWVKLGQTDESIRILKSNGVDEVVMAGHIRRPSLGEIRPDIRTLQVFARMGARGFGDDTLLRAVSAELEKDGLRVIGAHEVDPQLLTPAGVLGRVYPNDRQESDMQRAIACARKLGELDVGQAVVVQEGIVLAVEAVEGTDALIERCRKVKRAGAGGVLVKACKPQQDRRLDLPAIGMRTVVKCFEAGLTGIALSAGESIIIDRPAVIATADKLGIFIKGFNP